MIELNKYLLWFWTLRIGNLVDVLFIITSQFVDKLTSRVITVEKRIILNLLFTVTLIHLKNNWTLQSTLQKWRQTKFLKKSSSNPVLVKSSITKCYDLACLLLWSKSEHFETSLFDTRISEPKYTLHKSVIIEVSR